MDDGHRLREALMRRWECLHAVRGYRTNAAAVMAPSLHLLRGSGIDSSSMPHEASRPLFFYCSDPRQPLPGPALRVGTAAAGLAARSGMSPEPERPRVRRGNIAGMKKPTP